MEHKPFDEGVDYRAMYYRLAGEVESAIRTLIAAQQDCEELLLRSADAHDSTPT